MAQKSSAAKKARYSAYAGNSTAAKNKEKKVVRHLKAHPNDEQSRKRATPSIAGKPHVKRDPLMAKISRMMKTGAFGTGPRRTKKEAAETKAA